MDQHVRQPDPAVWVPLARMGPRQVEATPALKNGYPDRPVAYRRGRETTELFAGSGRPSTHTGAREARQDAMHYTD